MRSEEYFVVDGVKYTVKRPSPRPDMKQLTKDGIVVVLDFTTHFDWLHSVIERWGSHTELIKPTPDKINGMYLKMNDCDVLVKVTQLHPKSKQAFCMECYNMPRKKQNETDTDESTDKPKKQIKDDKSCDLQLLANLQQVPARYIVIPKNTKGGATLDDRKKIMTAAQVMSTILLGARIYVNITKYRVFDDVTRTYGSRIFDIVPIYFCGKDFLLEC